MRLDVLYTSTQLIAAIGAPCALSNLLHEYHHFLLLEIFFFYGINLVLIVLPSHTHINSNINH
jgi:hypothetical protein